MYVTSPADQLPNMSQSSWLENEPRSAELRVRVGSYLYYEGDPVEYLYRVKSGVLRLTRVLEDK